MAGRSTAPRAGGPGAPGADASGTPPEVDEARREWSGGQRADPLDRPARGRDPAGAAEPADAGPGARRRRLAELLGDVLPDITEDERPERAGGAPDDRWYLENRPPHH